MLVRGEGGVLVGRRVAQEVRGDRVVLRVVGFEEKSILVRSEV